MSFIIKFADGSTREIPIESTGRLYPAEDCKLGDRRIAKLENYGLGLEPKVAMLGNTSGVFAIGEKVWVKTDSCSADLSQCRYFSHPSFNADEQYPDFVVAEVFENDRYDQDLAKHEEFVGSFAKLQVFPHA